MQPAITLASGSTTDPFFVQPDGWVIIEAGSASATLQYTTGTPADITNGTATWVTAGSYTGFTAIRADEELADTWIKLTAASGSITYHVEGELSKTDRLTIRSYKKTSVNSVAPSYALDSSGNVTGLVGPGGDTHGVVIDGVDDPVSAPTPALGAAGVLTGTYGYAVSFVTGGGETAVWAGTASTVTAASQQINLSAIPVSSDSRVIARKLYRTIGTAVDVKDYFLLTTINDNTTTTYTDNTADGSLGAPAPWISTTKGFVNIDGSQVAAIGNGQAVAVGPGAAATKKGYACTAVGYNALNVITSGRRNSAVGIYALTSLTTGYENTATGAHAGQSVVGNVANSFYGVYAGFYAGSGAASGNLNVAFGRSALFGTVSGIGQQNVAVGAYSLQNINTADQCVGIGPYAGQFANASRQLFIDTGGSGRANLAAQQDIGLIYGKGETTAQAQDMRINAITRIGPGAAATALVANLQAASAALKGYRGWVSDATVAYTSANVGTTVAGGGANAVPVFCNGTAWVIG